MNWRNFLLIGLFLITSNSFSQINLLNAKDPDEIGVKTQEQIDADNDHPLEYGYVDTRDVLWAKMTWERIVLDERVNFPLYYPIDTSFVGQERRSLYDVIMKSLKKGDIEKVYADSYFTEERTLEDLEASLKKVDTLDAGYEQLNAGEELSDEYIETRILNAADVAEFRIKGYWYFDKRQGELKYRLIALCPVAPDVNFIDSETPDLVELFWIFYPDVREVLNSWKSFNNKNSANPISFDHLLNSRRFSGVIYKEENVYQDRLVNEYINENALMQLLESDRIREKIRDFEMDQWNY
ncbi:MAG: gliding motility protein GldN [Flavobacteriaceae bacterium]|nr:gliding motility protein GldN [Flavobacteriaceae bacterium]